MKAKIQVITIAAFFLALSLIAWFKPATEVSDSELRKLAQFPQVSQETIFNGKFMADFEKYSLDQFPLRDNFRTVKALTYLYAMGQMDNNGIYIEDGYAAKMEYPLSDESIEYAIGRIDNVYNKFIKDSEAKCYIAVIPDKSYYLAADHGALSMDYQKLFSEIENGVDYAQYISLTDILSKEDYYRTDTHWDQTQVVDVAKRIAETMGADFDEEFVTHKVEEPFYGVYYGQAALPMKPDEMKYLTNAAIDSAVVYDHQNSKEIPVYDESMMNTRSPYDLFLGGSLSLITIENPLADNGEGSNVSGGTESAVHGKELIVFRDSFGSSLVPLLISGYSKITIVDIRYLPSDRLGYFIDFTDQDVLFLYSSLVLNNSNTLK